MTDGRERKTWPPKDGRGVVCPRCGCADLRVLNTRHSLGRIVRYRQCRHCSRRVTTYEVTPAMLADPVQAEGRQ
jgi:transcriptional regulator NrdR family protein